MNSSDAPYSAVMLPTNGTSKTKRAASRMIDAWMRPIAMYGMILPVITSSGVSGIASRFSIVPRSRSRVIARPVIITSVIVRITPISPGTMLYCVIDSGL